MSKDLTQKLNGSLEDKVDRLIAAVQSMDSRLESMDSRVESMESRLESMDSRVESMESRLESMDSHLESLETKVDRRLRETQPIWETVQGQLAEIRESQQRQGEDIAWLRSEVASLRADTEKGFRTFDRRMERQIGEFERLHAYQRDLEDRVDKIEKRSTP
jgi:chromosome segregation ATPase